jgi:hypothetical protein
LLLLPAAWLRVMKSAKSRTTIKADADQQREPRRGADGAFKGRKGQTGL